MTNFSGTYFYANGKRKTAVARVRLYKGTGLIVINDKDAKEYLGQDLLSVIQEPLKLTNTIKDFNISVKVAGGGLAGQADAIRHGIARALIVADSDHRAVLKPEGYLTRDSRIKERKKFGLRKARRAPQFSKR
jgi:small subunit ribosomal protein S9